MIEFNKHHYSDLWVKRDYYAAKLGTAIDPYEGYISMIGDVIAPKILGSFPPSIQAKQDLIKIIMLAQADAVHNKLDVSSLKPPPKRTKTGLFNMFKKSPRKDPK